MHCNIALWECVDKIHCYLCVCMMKISCEREQVEDTTVERTRNAEATVKGKRARRG